MAELTDNNIKAIVWIREAFCITLYPLNTRLISDSRVLLGLL